ncbi:cytochrome P450 [Streptomyces sp. H27-D2]|uniref:cytochrome P450 n=1 Tax=Streptomyces sp. H27-D2 TaxID=3046304 RepID=UPI002DB968C8|nr:cytochrome P450 [Streptomyces sp. H27-D2]MEC4016313.1 cytochrome P450 [Streptomyces sp. H27-D2]
MPKPSDIPVHQRRNGIDPLPELSRMSAETPLVAAAGPGMHDWIATGREEVRAILGDADRFSTRPPTVSEEDSRQLVEPGNLLQYDPPEHTRLRKMLTPEFTVRRMRRMEPIIEKVVADQLDALERAGQPADLMRHFAWPVPGLVACGLLGLPRDDLTDLARMLDIRATSRSRKKMVAAKALDNYLVKIMARKRRDPGEDLLGMLIREHGEGVTDQELAGICSSFVAAALEGSTQMLGLGTLALLEHPGQLALLRDRPELTDQAVEELLRYVAVVSTASPRTALVNVPLAGQVIKAGEVVGCSLLAANRAQDPDAPQDDFDITRENTTHLAFGHGVHYCVGASLGRMQLRIAFAGLLRRFPELRLAVPPDELRFRLFAPQYGVEALPVAW